jgi:hypothetical protein
MYHPRPVYGLLGFLSLALVLSGGLMLLASPTWGSEASGPYGAQSVTPLLFALPYLLLGLVMVVLGIVGAIWAFLPTLQRFDAVERHLGNL